MDPCVARRFRSFETHGRLPAKVMVDESEKAAGYDPFITLLAWMMSATIYKIYM